MGKQSKSFSHRFLSFYFANVQTLELKRRHSFDHFTGKIHCSHNLRRVAFKFCHCVGHVTDYFYKFFQLLSKINKNFMKYFLFKRP